MPTLEIDSNAVSVLHAIKDGSIDSLKFCFNSGMFPNATDPDSDTKNSLHCMCGLAAENKDPEVLKFLLESCIFKHEKVEDILFKCVTAIVREKNLVSNQVLIDCTLNFFKTTELPLDTFAARCMREYSQEAALVQNWDMLRKLWTCRSSFPIPEQYDENEKKNIGKDKEFLPAVITGAVFFDNLPMAEYALNLPDRWQEYSNQCMGTWFRMAMEAHSPSVANYLLPYVVEQIKTDAEYAATVLKDSLRTGCYDVHLRINQILIYMAKNTP
jgi:hypothetical protein